MLDHLIAILQTLLPTGGLGALMVWLTSKNLRKLRELKEEHETYKAMYDDVMPQLIKVHHDYTQILSLLRLAPTCKYYDHCPLRGELQRLEKDRRARAAQPGGSGSARGQPSSRRDCAADDYTHDFPGGGGQPLDGDTDAEPP